MRIREALLARGLGHDLVDEALDVEGTLDQVERATALLGRRAAPLTSDSERAKALTFLTRRGFDYEVAYEAVRKAA